MANDRLPTTTILQGRLQMYEASKRPKTRNETESKNKHGRCVVTGKLGQRHQDLLDSVMYHAENPERPDDLSIDIIVDPAAVRRTMAGGENGETYSRDHIERLIAELRSVTVKIYSNRLQSEIIGGLIDHVVKDEEVGSRPGIRRNLWKVRLGAAAVELLEQDYWLYYNPALIAKLHYGITQSVARWVLGQYDNKQPKGGWYLDTVIKDNVIKDNEHEIPKRQLRKLRMKVREEAEELSEIGINLSNDRITKAKRK